jgi:hypothetical protein
MKRAELKELLRATLYEAGEVKRRNRERKRAMQQAQIPSDSDPRLRAVSGGTTSGVRASQAGGRRQHSDPNMPYKDRFGSGPNPVPSRSDTPDRNKHVSQRRSADPLQHRQDMRQGMAPQVQHSAQNYRTMATMAQRAASGDDDTHMSRSYGDLTPLRPGAPKSGGSTSSVPDQVRQAASKEAGGKVVFGRYYDARGQYLGRTQGGQWVDGKTDSNAQTQMEMYNKLQELKNKGFTGKDKEHVKKMVRELVKSCG